MTHRTKTGKSLKRNSPKSRKRSTAKDGAPRLANLGPIVWSFGLLTLSVALAAAAVFTHKT